MLLLFLDNRLIDGGEVVKLMRRPPFTHRKIPGTHFCYRLSRPQGQNATGRIRSIKKSNDLIGNRTREFPARSTVPQQTTLLRSPAVRHVNIIWLSYQFIKQDNVQQINIKVNGTALSSKILSQASQSKTVQ
jgi:hypothetical protein